MIPKFHIPKITRKLSLDANIRRLRTISNMLNRRTPKIQDKEIMYMYLIEQGDVGSTYDQSGEIHHHTIENILNFWFRYKPDPTHDPQSTKKDDFNSKGIHMAASQRENPFGWNDYWHAAEEYIRDKDGEYFEYQGGDVYLGYVLELKKRLLTPQEEVYQETGMSEISSQYNKIHTSVDSTFVAIPDGQSYLYVDGGAWVKIIYLGTTENDDWYKTLIRERSQYDSDLAEAIKRAGINI